MDNMVIESAFTTGVISKMVTTVLRKKMGHEVDVQLNTVTATITDGKTHIHLDVDAEISKEELLKLLKDIL